jgi:selenocysteine lyase/cysteine desulfurase
MEKLRVYADNAGTTRLSKTALDAMMPYLTEKFGNPSAVYGVGREAKKAVEESREKVAFALGADRERYISPAAGPSRTTGRSAEYRMCFPKRENISLPRLLSTTPSPTRWSRWKSRA